MERANNADDADRADPSDALVHVESVSGTGIEQNADTEQTTLLLERPQGASDEALPQLEFLVGGILGEKVSIAAVG
jgi:hypothetical protein